MADQKELQEKILSYRILQSRLESLIRGRELIANKIVEIESTLASIDEFVNSKEKILFSLGSETYVFGEVNEKEKLIVGVGAGIALEKTMDEGKNTLNKRKTELEKIILDIQKEVMKVSVAIEQLAPEIQKLIESQQVG